MYLFLEFINSFFFIVTVATAAVMILIAYIIVSVVVTSIASDITDRIALILNFVTFAITTTDLFLYHYSVTNSFS